MRENKSSVIRVRVTKAEANRIQLAANRTGISVSAFGRVALMHAVRTVKGKAMRNGFLVVALSSLTWLSSASTSAVGAEFQYQFPDGVPIRRADVTFYRATDHYQNWSEVSSGVHDRRYNISAAKPFEKFGNANYEFPWKTGMTDASPNATSFKFTRLPEAQIVVSQDRRGIHWVYPEGSLFGEVLNVDGRTFEVRTMTKKAGEWDFCIYRPFGKREEVAEYIVADKWRKGRLRNRHPAKTVIDATAIENEIELTPKGTEAVLSRAFRDVTNERWAERDGLICHAPTTSKAGGIVPIKYQGAWLSADSCKKCHDTTNANVNEFEPARDWYGAVRGSDSVLSFSIFDDSCASGNGFSRPVKFRKDLPLVRK